MYAAAPGQASPCVGELAILPLKACKGFIPIFAALMVYIHVGHYDTVSCSYTNVVILAISPP